MNKSRTVTTGKRVLEYVEITRDGKGRKVYVCTKCGKVLGAANKSFKEYAVVKEVPYSYYVDAGILSIPSSRFVIREFFCPKCAIRFDTESVIKGEPYLDIRIDGE